MKMSPVKNTFTAFYNNVYDHSDRKFQHDLVRSELTPRITPRILGLTLPLLTSILFLMNSHG